MIQFFLLQSPEIIKLYEEIVARRTESLGRVEQIKKFELLPHEWTIDSGELTPTLKLKRKVIMEKYKTAVDRIYS